MTKEQIYRGKLLADTIDAMEKSEAEKREAMAKHKAQESSQTSTGSLPPDIGYLHGGDMDARRLVQECARDERVVSLRQQASDLLDRLVQDKIDSLKAELAAL